MPIEFILIPGRSSRQGVTLNEGKYTDGYLDETSTLRMNPSDMQRIGVSEGDEVRMWNDIGEVVVPCIDAKDECPEGIVFICYGDKSSQLMGGETHGSGMPDSKGLDVFVHPASQPKPAQLVTKTAETKIPAPRQESEATQETAIETPTPAPSASKAPTSEDPVHPDAPLQIGVTITMALFVITLIGLAVIMYLSR